MTVPNGCDHSLRAWARTLPAALAKAIPSLADDPEPGGELGESGANHVRIHFDGSVLARKMIDILLKYAAEDAEGAFT